MNPYKSTTITPDFQCFTYHRLRLNMAFEMGALFCVSYRYKYKMRQKKLLCLIKH